MFTAAVREGGVAWRLALGHSARCAGAKMSCGVDVSLIEASNMASTRAAGLKDGAYPIWDWLARHHPLDQRALQSLLVDDGAADKGSAIFSILKQKRLHSSSIDSFISFLKTGFRGGSLCISPNCMGCYHSGQDVLLFVHKLSEFLRNAPHIGDSKLVADLVSFSRECRVLQSFFRLLFCVIPTLQSLLYTSSTKLEEYYRQEWRFLSFEERKGYYRVFSRMCKPLLISLSRLFFTLFRGFLKVRFKRVACSAFISDRLIFPSFGFPPCRRDPTIRRVLSRAWKSC